MWEKIKSLKYPLLAKYYFSGVILAVLVFQFVTISLTNNRLQFNSLTDFETLKFLIAGLGGALAGGLIFVIIMIYDNERESRDRNLWKIVNSNNRKWFRLKFILAFPIGGFIYLFLMNILDLVTIDNHQVQSLFSHDNTIEYIGIIIAGVFFGLLLTTGMISRLKSMYNN